MYIMEEMHFTEMLEFRQKQGISYQISRQTPVQTNNHTCRELSQTLAAQTLAALKLAV